MAKRKSSIGSWAFLVGVVLALIVSFWNPGQYATAMAMALAIIGLVIGLLNVADQEVTPFLMSGAVLIIASGLGQTAMASLPFGEAILGNLLLIFVPATIIVAIKNVYSLAKD